jgi:hypothetical protein
MASKAYAIPLATDGQLITALSHENVGERNFTRILNLRRFKDTLIRRDGWEIFIGATEAVFDGVEAVMRLAELVRPNGERVIVGASRTKLKKYDTGTALWTDISGGLTFSASGKRWQAVQINGYLILNNAVNLPVSYRVEDAAVTPIYEMRQGGYARVGRIYEANGFLKIADLTKIKADQLATWMNGYSNYTVSGTQAKNANFNVVFGDHQDEFDVTTGAGDIVASLPALVFNEQPFYFWLTKVDAGAGEVTTSPDILDEEVVLDSINDTALILWNGSRWVAKVFAGGVIPATDPYGTPPDDIMERYPWAVANSEFGEPTRWAPSFSSLMAAAATSIVLPFNPSTWVANQTRVGVFNAGPSGTILGGQIGYDDGVLITAIGSFNAATMGVTITLEVSTNVDLTYPRIVRTTRWTDINTIVAEYQLVGDGSEIIGAITLGELEILFRSTSIYVGRYTGDALNPFVYVPRYPGSDSLNLPIWGDAIANVNGDYLLYPGVGGRFYKFDGVSWPTIHERCDNAKELFFDGILPTDEPFAVANPQTKEIWFCRPDLTMAYDFEFDSVSEIDEEVGAMTYVRDPASADQWVILTIDKTIYIYGLVLNAATPIHTWLRANEADPPSWTLRSGLISAGLLTDEKLLLAYTPVLASSSPDAAFEVQLYSSPNPSFPLTALLAPAESLPTPQGECQISTYFQDIFFVDEIIGTTELDIDFRISERVFEFERVGEARGVVRRAT